MTPGLWERVVGRGERTPSVLVTGSNRGLGFAWVERYATEGWRVFAVCRHPKEATALQELSRIHPGVTILRADVTSSEDIRALYWELKAEPIDLLINNAGVYLEKSTTMLGSLRYDDWLHTLSVNTLGQVRMVEALTENLARSRQGLVVAVTSHMGSVTDINSPGSYYYRSSKAALNCAMRGLAAELGPRGIGLFLVHPGGVATRMGPARGLPPAESVAGMHRLVERFDTSMQGRFFKYDGTELPW